MEFIIILLWALGAEGFLLYLTEEDGVNAHAGQDVVPFILFWPIFILLALCVFTYEEVFGNGW